MSDKLPFEPMTAREALLAIRVESVAFSNHEAAPGQIIFNISRLAEAGLDRTSFVNFELTDQLADRLAEAHELLRKVQQGHYEPESLSSELAGALALPPDLEAMVERRMTVRNLPKEAD